jgi:hypothetical protein
VSLELFHSDAFRSLMQKHLHSVITFLFENDREFKIAAEVSYLRFNPPLPGKITRTFDDVSLFALAGYTYESAWLDEEMLYFEAGFGEEDFATLVTIPLLAIRQIFYDQFPIAINVSSPIPFRTPSEVADPSSRTTRRSMEALLRNPENQKWLKNIKKS